MRQIIYDKVKHIADKYKGYIDTEDLMKEGLTNRQIGLLTAEGKLEKVAHGHYWIISPKFSKPEDYKAVEVALVPSMKQLPICWCIPQKQSSISTSIPTGNTASGCRSC